MSWQIPTIGRDDEKKIYIFAMNANSNKLSVGHLAHWYYYMSGTVTTASGYAVTHAPTLATLQLPPALAAGVVADEDIPQNQYGKIQKYGFHTGVYVTGCSTAPFYSFWSGATTHTASVFHSLLLRPAAAFGNTHGANASYGLFGVMTLGTTITTQAALDLRHFWPGGYAVPLGNPSVTMTYTSSASVPAFLKFL